LDKHFTCAPPRRFRVWRPTNGNVCAIGSSNREYRQPPPDSLPCGTCLAAAQCGQLAMKSLNLYSSCHANTWRHRVGQVVHIGQSFKASKTSKPTLKKRLAPSKAPDQKTAITTNQVHKENAMASNRVSYAFIANGKLSWSKTFGPWALAIACSAQTGGLIHSAQPYAPSA